MDKLWVKDVQIGERASGVFLVAKKQQSTGRNQKAFLKLTLQDKTGQLDARVWNDVEALAGLFDENDLVQVEAQVDSFQGHPQLTIDRLTKAEIEHDPSDFAYAAQEPQPHRPTGAEGQVSQLRAELTKVADPQVRALLLSFIDDPDVTARLRRAPAAKEIHHAYPGGLVEHMLSCVRLAQRLGDHYPMVDRDLLVAGAFLHDLGKIHELSYDKGGTGYTDEGRLVGHLVMTAQWIHERARAIPGFSRDLEMHLTHIVLAHHGRLEFGSPKLPMTIEAFLVHELDEIDSRVNSWLGQMARAQGEVWAEPSKDHERLLWKAAMPTESGKRRGPAWKAFGKVRPEKPKKKKREGAEGEVREARPPREPREGREAREPREAREGRAPREPREAREPRAPREAAEARPEAAPAAGGERRGPKILKRPEGGGRPAAGGEKLTFKPFSLLAAEEETEAPAALGELPETAGEAPREAPEAASTETLPEAAAAAPESESEGT